MTNKMKFLILRAESENRWLHLRNSVKPEYGWYSVDEINAEIATGEIPENMQESFLWEIADPLDVIKIYDKKIAAIKNTREEFRARLVADGKLLI